MAPQPPSLPVTVEVHLDPDGLVDRTSPRRRRAGSRDRPPWTPPMWFYDDAGSALFDEITRLPEYYPTRAERSILAARAGEIAELSPCRHAGRARLGHLGEDPAAARRPRRRRDLRRFVPFDVSEATLRRRGRCHRRRAPGPRGARRRRRLPPPPRRAAARRQAAPRLPRRHDRQPRPAERARFLFDVDAILGPATTSSSAPTS